ncbi:MAG: hypothetical protein ACR2PT_16525 [Endozoicomonas sp.]
MRISNKKILAYFQKTISAAIVLAGMVSAGSVLADGGIEETGMAVYQEKPAGNFLLTTLNAIKILTEGGVGGYFHHCHPGLNVKPYEPVSADELEDLKKLNELCSRVRDQQADKVSAWSGGIGNGLKFSDFTLAAETFFPEVHFRSKPQEMVIQTRHDSARQALIDSAKNLREYGVEIEVVKRHPDFKLASKRVSAVQYLADEQSIYTFPVKMIYTVQVPSVDFSWVVGKELDRLNDMLSNLLLLPAQAERQNVIFRFTRFLTLLQPYAQQEVNQQAMVVFNQLLAKYLSIDVYATVLHQNPLGYTDNTLRLYYQHNADVADVMADDALAYVLGIGGRKLYSIINSFDLTDN